MKLAIWKTCRTVVTQDSIFHLGGKLGMNNMIIRNHASSSARQFKTADNRSQTTVNGPQLT